MLLKRLELQGFKSFAQRTEIEFDGGVTAIVGPNGSGKSNIADAIRWVLGEQSNRLLRTKKVEDVIFVGSANRTSVGMAEVTLTLDNSTGKLPLDFSEVSVTRRAYRSGESEYLINRRRARLKDVVDVLLRANVGQGAHTVLGQGLIDATLSLRPEERCTLIEEAADIKWHRLKMKEAQDNLKGTLDNLERLSFVVAEINPRLTQLQRQAKRAQEYLRLKGELDSLLKTYYSAVWSRASLALARGQERRAQVEAGLTSCRAKLTESERAIEGLKSTVSQERVRFGEMSGGRYELIQRRQRVAQSIRADSERLRLVRRQKEESTAEIAQLGAELPMQEEELSRVQQRLFSLEGQLAVASVEAQAQESLTKLDGELRRSQEAVKEAQDRSLKASAAFVGLENRLAQVAERSTEIMFQRERVQEKKASLVDKLRACTGELRSLQGEEPAQETSSISERRMGLEEQVAALRASIKGLREEAGELGREIDRLERRLAAIASAKKSGLPSGVSFLLRANAGCGHLAFLTGLVEVPSQFELAIEAALGEQLHGLMVDGLEDAIAGIGLLKNEGAGRVTFLPMDSMAVAPIDLPCEPGLVGSAAGLVSCDARYRPVVDALLGSVLVAQDMEAAWRLRSLGYDVVTLAGEVVRRNGSITGGAPIGQEEASAIAREREFRELPSLIEEKKARLGMHSRDLAEKEAGLGVLLRQGKALEKDAEAQASRQRSLEEQVSRRRRELEQLRQEFAWQTSLIGKGQQELLGLSRRKEDLLRQKEEAEREKERSSREVEHLSSELTALQGRRAGLVTEQAEQRAQRGTLAREIESQRGVRQSWAGQLERLRSQLEARKVKARQLEQEDQALVGRLGISEREQADIEASLHALEQ